jgi:hypothetical protein
MADGRLSRWAPAVALAMVVAGQLGLTLYFQPPSLVFGPEPIGGFDWELHFGQVHDAVQAFQHGHRSWAYDPQRLAGQLTGVIFDANTKGWEAWTLGLGALGVPTHVAFNLFAWLGALLAPVAVWASARWFGLGRAAAVVAAALGSACFFFDAFAHWCTWIGMVSWATASYTFLLPLALFWRWLATRSPWALAGVGALLALSLLAHPYSFVPLVVPMGLLYLRAWRSLGWREHAGLGAVVVGVLLCHLWWLLPTLRFWHYTLEARSFLDGTVSYLLTDYLGLLQEPAVTGVMAMRSGFRFLGLGGALLGLWLWRKERDPRFAPFAAGLGVLLALAYLGGHSETAKLLQPYRFVLPATYLSLIPAASFLERAVVTLRQTRPHPIVWALLGLTLFVAVPRLARDVIYFVPEAVPAPTRPLVPPPPDINAGPAFGTIRWPKAFDYRQRAGGHREEAALADYVNATDDGSGRWLVDWWPAAERLTWATHAQILGGFTEINLAHSDANLFRRYADAPLPGAEELRDYLRQYNVRWVVLASLRPELERPGELLRFETTVGRFRIFRVLEPSSFIVGDGPGTVQAALNSLRVKGSAGGELVLRYHWLETLRCRPGCELHRVEVPGDRVGFIGVSNAPPDFEIGNSYR